MNREASIAAEAFLPTWIPGSATASEVTVEVRMVPPPMSGLSWLVTGPRLTATAWPLRTCLALIFLAGLPAAYR